MILTGFLTLGMMALLFLAILTATLTLPSKALAKNFPADVQERLAPRLDNLPMSGKRILGILMLILLAAGMLGLVLWSGVDGIHNGYSFWDFLIRFLIMFGGWKAFDIIALDFILLTKTQFFQHFFPETKDCAGWKDFGFNRRQPDKALYRDTVLLFRAGGNFYADRVMRTITNMAITQKPEKPDF